MTNFRLSKSRSEVTCTGGTVQCASGEGEGAHQLRHVDGWAEAAAKVKKEQLAFPAIGEVVRLYVQVDEPLEINFA